MWSVWLVFCDCGFQSVCPLMEKDKRLMEASWWERLTEGKLGLVLMGRAMLSKSLIQFSVNGWGSSMQSAKQDWDCEVKWALGSITMNKASGGDGIPVELFQILKDDAVKYTINISAKSENSAVAKRLENQFSLQSQRKAMSKNVQTTTQLHSFHMLAK